MFLEEELAQHLYETQNLTAEYVALLNANGHYIGHVRMHFPPPVQFVIIPCDVALRQLDLNIVDLDGILEHWSHHPAEFPAASHNEHDTSFIHNLTLDMYLIYKSMDEQPGEGDASSQESYLATTAPTWGGPRRAIKPKSERYASHEDMGKIEAWIHEVTTFCETLPCFVLHEQSTVMFHRIVNFDRAYLRRRYRISSASCDAIYRLLFVYTTGFFDNVAEWLKKVGALIQPDKRSYDEVLDYMARLYAKMMESIAYKHYASQLRVVESATMMELEEFQLTQQRLVERMSLDQHKARSKLRDKRGKLERLRAQNEALKGKLAKLAEGDSNYDSALADYKAVLQTQTIESENLSFRIHDHKLEARQLKEREDRLNVVLPIAEQNQSVLWKALSKLKLEIELIVKERRRWIAKLKEMEAAHSKLEEEECDAESLLLNQRRFNQQETARKEALLRRMDELNELFVNGDGVIGAIQGQMAAAKRRSTEKQLGVEALKLRLITLADDSENVAFETKRRRNDVFAIQTQIATTNQNIRVIFESVEKTEKSRRDHKTRCKVRERQKRLKSYSIDKLKGELGGVLDALRLLEQQNEVRRAQFELSKEKLARNQREIDGMNSETRQMRRQRLSCQLKHQNSGAEVARSEQRLEAQSEQFEDDERAFAHRMEYLLQRHCNLESRRRRIQARLDARQQTKQEREESILETHEAIAVTRRKAEAAQLQIAALLQQLDTRRVRVWRAETLKDIKYVRLSGMRAQSASKTDSVDHIFDIIGKIKTKYNLDLNELARSIWVLHENHAQKQKQLKRINFVMAAVGEEHRKRMAALAVEHEASVKALSQRLSAERERRRYFTAKMGVLSAQCDGLEWQHAEIDETVQQDEAELTSYREENTTLEELLRSHISPNSITDKKADIYELELKIKRAMLELQNVRRVKTFESRGVQNSGLDALCDSNSSVSSSKVALITASNQTKASVKRSVSLASRRASSSSGRARAGKLNQRRKSTCEALVGSRSERLGRRSSLKRKGKPLQERSTLKERLKEEALAEAEADAEAERAPLANQKEMSLKLAAIEQALSMKSGPSFGELAELELAPGMMRTKSRRASVMTTPPKVYVPQPHGPRDKVKLATPALKRRLTIPKAPKLTHKKETVNPRLRDVDWNKALKMGEKEQDGGAASAQETVQDGRESEGSKSKVKHDAIARSSVHTPTVSIGSRTSLGGNSQGSVALPGFTKLLVATKKWRERSMATKKLERH